MSVVGDDLTPWVRAMFRGVHAGSKQDLSQRQLSEISLSACIRATQCMQGGAKGYPPCNKVHVGSFPGCTHVCQKMCTCADVHVHAVVSEPIWGRMQVPRHTTSDSDLWVVSELNGSPCLLESFSVLQLLFCRHEPSAGKALNERSRVGGRVHLIVMSHWWVIGLARDVSKRDFPFSGVGLVFGRRPVLCAVRMHAAGCVRLS